MKKQSPIDIIPTEALSDGDKNLCLYWKPFEAQLEDTGYLIRAYGHGGYLTFKKQRFDFVEFHFHTPSEHMINHQKYPMEIHFVHHNQILDHNIVLSVLIEAVAPSAELQKLTDAFDHIQNSKPITINPKYFLPQQEDIFYYEGSLTVAPCTENVSWQIFCHSQSASQEQIDSFRALRDNNDRKVHSLCERKVHKTYCQF
ncbi:MAG: carbonic anhydrase family protein [Alphaproteobacteria bacterium]